MTSKKIEREIEFPENVKAKLEGAIVSLKGPKGEVKRDFTNKKIKIELRDNSLILTASKSNKREKKIIGSTDAHIRNMIKGATEGHMYKLKICSGHFPMNVTVKGSDITIKNFIGEKVPRVLRLKQGANVKVEGDVITVESTSKEIAGQVSADIETLTRRTGYDPRVFQDGIYITNKDGKEIK